MSEKQDVIEKIHRAFDGNEFPGERFLQASYEGTEPYEEVGPFEEKKDWKAIDAAFLDARSAALSFFSQAALRYFLPAFLIADLDDELNTADPLSHLTSGFHDLSVRLPTKSRVFVVKSGKSAFINPRRYGAATMYDYARYRLSVFTREEAGAIVAYLRFKRANDPDGFDHDRIDSALESFWLEREQKAPLAESLQQHLKEQKEYLDAIRPDG